MSAGLEIRGNSLRIWIRNGEKHYKETLEWKNTPEGLERARTLVNIIKGELKLGSFALDRHFPNSRYLKKNRLKHYIDLYINDIEKEVAPSTFYSYKNQVNLHIKKKWNDVHPMHVDTQKIKAWIIELKATLNSKTVKEIVSRFEQVYSIWRIEHKIAYNIFETISVVQLDSPEPDPFNKNEIKAILETKLFLDIEYLIPCLIWTGLSISEQMALAWEDIDLDTGILKVNRGYIRYAYRVTKNRRRNREIQLLQPVIEALKKQYQITGNLKPALIEVLQRDNQTFKKEQLRFVWINSLSNTHFKYHELSYRWRRHLRAAGVRKRGINQGRHTFASQLLSSGQVPPEWIADQLGHADTSMIYKHYGKLIAEDIPDYASRINTYINK